MSINKLFSILKGGPGSGRYPKGSGGGSPKGESLISKPAILSDYVSDYGEHKVYVMPSNGDISNLDLPKGGLVPVYFNGLTNNFHIGDIAGISAHSNFREQAIGKRNSNKFDEETSVRGYFLPKTNQLKFSEVPSYLLIEGTESQYKRASKMVDRVAKTSLKYKGKKIPISFYKEVTPEGTLL